MNKWCLLWQTSCILHFSQMDWGAGVIPWPNSQGINVAVLPLLVMVMDSMLLFLCGWLGLWFESPAEAGCGVRDWLYINVLVLASLGQTVGRVYHLCSYPCASWPPAWCIIDVRSNILYSNMYTHVFCLSYINPSVCMFVCVCMSVCVSYLWTLALCFLHSADL